MQEARSSDVSFTGTVVRFTLPPLESGPIGHTKSLPDASRPVGPAYWGRTRHLDAGSATRVSPGERKGGQTSNELPAATCRVRPQKAGSTGKLAYGRDFVWPM